ncbi:glycosyl hydrolase 115 family protein [Pelagicoccus sp. NFK12]|uniref:Glycosyl hydrolase 115 family protein n=1 Tax=Pelagicoccus enzymogenes TaxID=2773457 RepID=A0A927FET2_9BACT|nr:glycosyl hydrolase 115 family protein [Pelagicoccus enzymogenes]MBD5782466.1 glycosyl hydrolase 115 family protein [Pelagicoccus enzymogenes]
MTAHTAFRRLISTTLAFLSLATASSLPAQEQQGSRYLAAPFLPILDSGDASAFPVADNRQAAPIHFDAADATVVRIAAEALAADIQRVTGTAAQASSTAPAADSQPILIGTLGQSPLIDSLVKSGQLDVSAVAGEWEAYTASVVKNPLPGIAKALVIAGSDRRGTAFGVFALSEAMGVSPWYWWGDIPTKQREQVFVASGTHVQPSPGVKYRGIFLNDEDWGLQPWAAKTFEPETGNIGPRTYAKIFELLLRLQSNIIWPAMHEFPVHTTPFYLDPRNPAVADDYAIVISTSHHEPMLRNSHEYDEGELGPYNYWTHRDTIYKFWEERVKETAGYENMYTIGLRGRTDQGMLAPEGTTIAQKAAMIQNQIIPDQRQMLADHVNPDPSRVPQIFIPYKETLVQYQAGLELPDDVTILWPDDNHGYIRQLPTAAERQRSGGSGVYYHLSYWGVPRSYLWLCTTPPGMTRVEMMKAWDFEAHRMWLVNVGDLKPHEIGTEFFLRLARDPESFRDFDQHAYLAEWAARDFSPENAKAIADILEEYYRLNIVTRPEQLNLKQTRFDSTGALGHGDQASARLQALAALTAQANALYETLPANQQAAFYQLILFPIRAADLTNQKVLLAERSRLWAEQGRAAANQVAAQAQEADDALRAEIAFCNTKNADGKWNYMFNPMDTSELPRWAHETQSIFLPANTASYEAPAAAGLGVAIEGAANTLAPDTTGQLPPFRRATDRSRFIDIFNTGTDPFTWTATPSAPWVTLSQSSGTADTRLSVSIDWASAPKNPIQTATIAIEAAGATRTVALTVHPQPELDLATLPAHLLDYGQLKIKATSYAERRDSADSTGWRRVSQSNASGDGMELQPVTAASLDPAALPADAPALTYTFHAFEPGPVSIEVRCLPTHRITSDHPGLRYAISVNGEEPQILDLHANEYTPAWNANTLRAYSAGLSQHDLENAGLQTITIQMVDPGLILDQIVVKPTSGTN